MARGRKPATGRFKSRAELCAWVWRWYLGTEAKAPDIARQCGVTPPTVHKILNTREGYPEEKEVSKNTPIALPVKLGMANGFNGNLMTDANDDPLALLYGLFQNTRVDELRATKRAETQEALARADYMVEAINQHAANQRSLELLRAAFDILKQQHDSGEVLNCLSLHANYDGTSCDGHCLMEDIANHLGIEIDD